MWVMVLVVCSVIGVGMLVLMGVVSFSGEINDGLESSYECGFDSGSVTRQSFSLRFFMIAILFLIFDVEISLMLPVPFLLFDGVSLLLFVSFCWVLLFGLVYEMWWGSLDWAI